MTNIYVPLKTNVLDVDSRVNEVHEIRNWALELVNQDTSLFNIKFQASGKNLIVWFEHDEHAAAFALRWV